jgi:metal-responsive CopG/Arc/MetJ family transcriptional regulator
MDMHESLMLGYNIYYYHYSVPVQIQAKHTDIGSASNPVHVHTTKCLEIYIYKE